MQEYFTEQGPTYAEAMRKAEEKYGERLKILVHETVKIPGGFLNLFRTDGVKIMGIKPSPLRPVYKERNYQSETNFRSEASFRNEASFAEEKEKILALANTGKDNSIKEVLAEIKAIRDKLEISGLAASQEEHPTLSRLDDILILNDFSPSYRKVIFDRIRKEITIDGLNDFNMVQDKVLEWIGDNIKISENIKFDVRPRIMVLVGPTGVGKTTTVAKLAANFGIDLEKANEIRRVTLVTIDAYRIGAKEQMEVYSEVMQFPCFTARNHGELKKVIAQNSDNSDLILIDTIGKSPRDAVQLGKMKMLLDACGTLAEVHLVVAATTKASDIKEILKTFEPFNYRSLIITKMDETIRCGNVISALFEKNAPISYITDGQTVPTDIRRASVIQFLINLEGFKVNRLKLEDKFPAKGQEHIQQRR